MGELKYLNKFFYDYRSKIIIGIIITIIARIFALVAPNLIGNSITLIDQYTLNNSIFCSKFDKNNSNLNRKIIDIKKKLNNGLPTVPSSIKDELDCNIFLRAKNLKEFSKLRDLKDNF